VPLADEDTPEPKEKLVYKDLKEQLDKMDQLELVVLSVYPDLKVFKVLEEVQVKKEIQDWTETLDREVNRASQESQEFKDELDFPASEDQLDHQDWLE